MNNNFDDEIDKLQRELDRRIEHAEGDTEEDRTEYRKRAFDELSSKIIEVQCQKKFKEAESSTAGGGSSRATTIIAEPAVKIFCKSLSPADIARFADQLRDHRIRCKKSHTRDQIRMMFSEIDRLEITQTLKNFRFSDGAAIEDAANWMNWEDNDKLGEILKLVYPISEAVSDVQRILQLTNQFKIYHAKNPRHFKTFVAQLLQALQMEDRQDELMSLTPADGKASRVLRCHEGLH
jgi:hypothetical protein